MQTHCDDCPTTDLCRHPDEPCAKRYDAERARERARETAHIRNVPGGAAFLRVAAATGAPGVAGLDGASFCSSDADAPMGGVNE